MAALLLGLVLMPLAAVAHARWLCAAAGSQRASWWLQRSAVHRALAGRWLIAEYRRGRCHPDLLEGWPARGLDPHFLNWLVNLDVAAGRYTSALTRRAGALELPPQLHEVVMLNEAEALANLGRVGEALERVEALPCLTPFMAAARAGHRAWLLAQRGDAAGARAALEEGREDDLPEEYRAEWHFAKFLIHLGEAAEHRDLTGELARRETSQGLREARLALAEEDLATAGRLARRETSRRNLLFLRARLLERQGDDAGAAALYAEGAAHPYRAQGGEALLAWGDCLMRLGRVDEARRAWAWCQARDPESWAALAAAAR